MKVKILAADSMGVRSMATRVETEDVVILIDPAADVAPRRFGLGPHELELKQLEVAWDAIAEAAADADVVVVTHYHFDHHSPERRLEEIYSGKVVLVKSPHTKINQSQAERAMLFLSRVKRVAKRVEVADGKLFIFGDTVILCSNPVPHGPDPTLGWVLQVLVDDGEMRFVFTSDVQGFVRDEQLSFVLDADPHVVFADGPPTYLGERVFGDALLRRSKDNLAKLLAGAPSLRVLILDHHLCRELDFRQKLSEIFRDARVKTAAEFMGVEENLLEARRADLFRAQSTHEVKDDDERHEEY